MSSSGPDAQGAPGTRSALTSVAAYREASAPTGSPPASVAARRPRDRTTLRRRGLRSPAEFRSTGGDTRTADVTDAAAAVTPRRETTQAQQGAQRADRDRPTPLDRPAVQVASFGYDFDGERWWFSPEYQGLLGWPGARPRTIDTFLDDVDPADRDRVLASLVSGVRYRVPFADQFRTTNARGRRVFVAFVGHPATVDPGRDELVGSAFVTSSSVDVFQAAAVADALRYRPAIDQVKGALMLVYHLTADEAFAVLTRHSQQNNVKLHAIAAHLAPRLRNVSPSTSLALLLTEATTAAVEEGDATSVERS